MKNIQKGFGGMQFLMVGAIVAAASFVAVPKYNAFIDKAKLTEAFTFAGESKKRLSEFYMMNSRFPKSSVEAKPMVTESLSQPQFVDSVVVWPNHLNHDVIVKVYLKHGVVENSSGASEQFIYIAGDNAGSQVVWSCGATGINSELLPDNCKS